MAPEAVVWVSREKTISRFSGGGRSPGRCEVQQQDGGDMRRNNGGAFEFEKFVVIGHRGSGMNLLESSDARMKCIKENSIKSFNNAAQFPLDFVEFDVQVTKDGIPVIFHDNFILTHHEGAVIEKRIIDHTLDEVLCHGPQKDPATVGKTLHRKTKDGRIFEWKVENDDPFCTLEEAFHKVEPSVGFNIELKFDDNLDFREEQLSHVLQVILKVVFDCGKDRPIIFSSFQPDAALLTRKLQSTYPVFFLTNGGSQVYADARRNSIDEAVKLCLEGGLHGIVSDVRAVLRNPEAVARIRDSKLSLITYGQFNNVPDVVYMQRLMGVEGVIVDLVREITEAVLEIVKHVEEGEEMSSFEEAKQMLEMKTKKNLFEHMSSLWC